MNEAEPNASSALTRRCRSRPQPWPAAGGSAVRPHHRLTQSDPHRGRPGPPVAPLDEAELHPLVMEGADVRRGPGSPERCFRAATAPVLGLGQRRELPVDPAPPGCGGHATGPRLPRPPRRPCRPVAPCVPDGTPRWTVRGASGTGRSSSTVTRPPEPALAWRARLHGPAPQCRHWPPVEGLGDQGPRDRSVGTMNWPSGTKRASPSRAASDNAVVMATAVYVRRRYGAR